MNDIESLAEHNNFKKKIITAICIIVVIFVIAYFSKNKYLYRATDDATAFDYKTSNLDYVVANASGDADGDGLENWRENLLGSDPSSANTLNTNTVGGINSSNSNTVDANGVAIKSGAGTVANASSSISSSNLTDQVAISLYASANALRNNGDTSSSSMAAISGAIAEQALNKTIIQIDETKIKIVADNSKESLKSYANSVFGYVIVYYPQVDESKVLDAYYKNNDKTILNDLLPNIKSLELMLSEIYKVKVPSDVYNLHKELITYISSAIAVEKSLAKADSDVLSAMIAFKQLRTMQKSNEDLIAKYKDFYNKKNIVFAARDAGNIINR